MKICPACGNQFPDDANFCPMDASKLPPPVAAAPAPAPAPAAAPAPAPAATSAPTIMDAPKPVAGRFMLGRELSQTPTGTVYQASDLNGGGAGVAVKLVDPRALPTAMMADRALRELKQLSKVKTERIARVIDQGRHDDGRLYVATEVLAGQTLEDLVERGGPLSFERAKAIV